MWLASVNVQFYHWIPATSGLIGNGFIHVGMVKASRRIDFRLGAGTTEL